MSRLLFSRPSLNFRGDRHYQVDDCTYKYTVLFFNIDCRLSLNIRYLNYQQKASQLERVHPYFENGKLVMSDLILSSTIWVISASAYRSSYNTQNRTIGGFLIFVLKILP